MNSLSTTDQNRRWLLVDDNEDMLTALAAVLENQTSATIECHSSPASALAAFSAAPDCYDLVITDFQMPEMDGVELCRRIRALAPAQKVFLATGSGLLSEITAPDHGFCALLSKPFRFSALLHALAASGLSKELVCTI